MAPNPLERFFDLGDVEMVKPKSSNEEGEVVESSEDSDVKDSDEDFGIIGNPFLRKEIAEKTVQDVQKMREDAERFSNSVRGFDFEDILRDNLEGPRLPEEGLKSRHRNPPVYILREEMCSRNSEHMKWSDWVSCLHMRMGLPRWLTAATISLGIVFIIWLCLVIPHNAPKQKVKVTKAMEAANSVVKGSGAGPVIVADRMDLPPAYEEIANLHVAVPVHSSSAKAATNAAAKAKEAEASAA